MKFKIIFCLFLLSFFLNCNNSERKSLDLFLSSFDFNIMDYKVLAFVPIDGCSNCAMSAINYSRKADNQFLLILSSYSKKELDLFVEKHTLEADKIILDSSQLSSHMSLIPFSTPRFYLVQNGKINKVIDASDMTDYTKLFSEIDDFLFNDDFKNDSSL